MRVREGARFGYLHVPFDVALARRATKPIADDASEPQLRDWHRPLDLLPGGVETAIGTEPAYATSVTGEAGPTSPSSSSSWRRAGMTPTRERWPRLSRRWRAHVMRSGHGGRGRRTARRHG